MQRIDRWLGLVLALLGGAVFVSSFSFPNVPGQKVGAGFLPAIVGAALALCAAALLWRRRRAGAADAAPEDERYAAPFVVVVVTLAYIALADRLGFLLVTPALLFVLFVTFRVRRAPALWWALAGTMVVHVAFYKLLRIPLPWGLLRPFY